MKKYLLIFALGILCSCNPTPEIKTDTGVVKTVSLYGNKKYKYRVEVYYPTYRGFGRVFYFYTNVNYCVGDTIKIHS